MSTVLPVSHFLPASVQPLDAKGNPAAVDGVAVWEASDPALVTLEVAIDGMSANIVPTGALGHVQIRVRADGVLLTCEPATVLPMAQRYFLF